MKHAAIRGAKGWTNRRGFTLTELLVVIGIIGLMLALVLPAFTGLGRSAGMNSAVMQVRTTLALARQWAITSRQSTYVVFADGTTVSAAAATERDKAYRAFAVWGTGQTNYIKEWVTLAPGVVITSDASGFPGTGGHGDNVLAPSGTNTRSIPFPKSTDANAPVRVVAFKSDGGLDTSINSAAEVYLTEGIVDTTVATPTLVHKPKAMKFGIELQQLTGQARTRDYNL